MLLRTILPVVLSLVVGHATAMVNLTSTGCVDASGFETCQSKATSGGDDCVEAAADDVEVLACTCAEYIDNINCYASYCWDRVYECDYQEYSIQFLEYCPNVGSGLPYFPAPDDAPDACNCNLGRIYEAVIDSLTEGDYCTGNQTDYTNLVENADKITTCGCCAVSDVLSTMYDLCPNTDPSLIGYSEIKTLEEAFDVDFSDCASYLAEYNCVSDLSWSEIPGSTFLDASQIATTATGTLYNIGGTVTSPASGAVFTYSMDSVVYTISAASATAKGGGGGGSGDSSTSTATGAAAKSTGKSSGSARLSIGGFTMITAVASVASYILLAI